MAKEMRKEGYDPKVLYGIFRPTTPRYTWDERWQSAPYNEFVHFWLCFGRLYYDFSCFQFGEKSPVKALCTDSRYEVVGEYDYIEKRLITTGNYIIEWESRTEVGEVSVLKLVPIFI